MKRHIYSLIWWGWIGKTDSVLSQCHIVLQQLKRGNSRHDRPNSAMSDWNMETQHKTDFTNTHTWPLVFLHKYTNVPMHRMRMIVWMHSVAAVIPSAIILLLGQFSNNSLQLFARLLLVLQKLLHPLILLWNINGQWQNLTGREAVPVRKKFKSTLQRPT